MTFQTTINATQPGGIVGEFYREGPSRAQSLILNSGSAANNVIGRAFTMPAQGQAQAGGTGPFAGILANPKQYSNPGNSSGTLAPNIILPNNLDADFVTMGELIVALPGAFNVGDDVLYNTTTGALATQGPLATGTGSITTTTLTISAVGADSAPFAVGQVISGPNVVPGTIITAILTGGGGVGTATISPSQTAASGAISAAGSAPSGFAFVPKAKVTFNDSASAGLGVITLTN